MGKVNSLLSAAGTLAAHWKKTKPNTEIPPTLFKIAKESPAFSGYYDRVQENLQSIAGMDELLAGICYLMPLLRVFY